MNTEEDLERLQRHVQYLVDRSAILDCISRHSRGCDRHDDELITSAYHSDAIDEHGFARNIGRDYAAWVNPTHATASQVHTHNLTTHSCDIDGDVAHCDSYVLVV